MTDYRNDDLTGTAGVDVANAAEIGMSILVGTPHYEEPGHDMGTSVLYEAGEYSELTFAPPDQWWDEGAFSVLAPPTTESRIWAARTSGGTIIATLRVLTTGQLEAIGAGSSTDVTPTTLDFASDNWTVFKVHYVTSEEVEFRLYNRLDEWKHTLRVKIGGSAVANYREGCITGDVSIRFAERRTANVPLYVGSDRPNFVHIMFDDAPAQSYLKHMSSVADMIANGALLTRYYVATPLCAPSRANVISGKFGQNNGVFGNGGATDDWLAFSSANERYSIFARSSDLGRRVAFAGKFLHGYKTDGNDSDHDALWKPTGTDWVLMTAGAYQGFDYLATDNRDGDATLVDTTAGDVHDPNPDHYFTDRMTEFGEDFVTDHYARFPNAPFDLYLWPFSGHNNIGGTDPEDGGGYKINYPAAPRHRKKGPNWPAGWADPADPVNGDLGDDPPSGLEDYVWPEQEPNFNTKPTPLPGWMNDDTLDAGQLADEEDDYFNVVRQMQSANDMIIAVKAKILAEGGAGALANTVFVVTSDNGYERGEHAIRGKGDIYDLALRLPTVVEGPGVAAGQTITTVIQNIDTLPTLLEIAGVLPDEKGVTADDSDGFSWWGRVTGTPPTVERQTGFARYESGNVDSWEEALGSDEPPDWMGLLSANDDRYVTYNTDNLNPPEANRAEAYAGSIDPAMIANQFPSLPAYKTWPPASLLQVLLSTTGEASRTAQLQTWTLGIGERAITAGPVLAVDGSDDMTNWIDLDDSAGRWWASSRTTFPMVPEPVLAGVVVGDGVMISDDPYDPATSISSGHGLYEALVTDLDEQGNKGGSLQLSQNVATVVTPFVRRGRFRLGERPYAGQPVQWVTWARRSGSINPEAAVDGGTVDRIVPIPYEMVDGIWVSPIDYTWTLSPWFGPNPGTQHIYTLAGSQAPIVPLVRVAGPVLGVGATDPYGKHELGWSGGDLDRGGGSFGLLVGEWLVIDCANWKAYIHTTDSWDVSGDTGTDVQAYLDSNRADGPCWSLQPVMFEGNPADRRVYADFSGGGRASTTVLQVRAPKTNYAR